MRYNNIVLGRFVERPNRFIAKVKIDGQIKVCHVKNTGRCNEILVPEAKVILERSHNPDRKTEFDLVAVYKESELINIDSQAPNKVFGEWVIKSGYFGDVTLIRPETKYGNSRFDYYIESGERRIFVEVKGVTLEKDGVLMFPDAPTERGVKHLRELSHAVDNGFEAFVFFVAQMKNCRYFIPNRDTHAEFAEVLKEVEEKGVHVRCVNCNVFENGFDIDGFVDVKL